MKIDTIFQVAVNTVNLGESISFYRDMLGADFQGKFDPPGIGFFNFSGTRLFLEKTGVKSTIYFRVDNLEQAFTDLTSRGVSFTDAPHLVYRDEEGTFGNPGEEEWMAFFEDPSGNVLALVDRRPTAQ